MALHGPLPADTAFLPAKLEGFDAVLAMYHDQGLPVLKYSGFERAVNLTLGLPYPRVAVDHGTALDIAGTGRSEEHTSELQSLMRHTYAVSCLQKNKSSHTYKLRNSYS